jgi:hypothetical protein
MRHFLKALLIFALAAGAPAAEADPPGRVGRLNYSSGAVSFAPGEAPDNWGEAVLNRPLTSGDRLWADRGARGELHVGSTAVRFASLTQMDVLRLDDNHIQLRLSEGVLNVRVRELDSDDLIVVAAPAGTAVLREPGSYRIAADPTNSVTYVSVNFGQAEVLTPVQSFVVPSGQVAVVPAAGQIGFEVAGRGDDFDRWSAERDSREDRVASTRYVSSYMTGYEDLDQHGSWRTVPEYGAVWVPARVAPGWAPYRYGRWVWVSPWGWTWIDDAPWGFAPFHYGRWVWVHDHWAWAPGRLVRRPVYAPALVAFVGGPHWAVSIAQGPAVGWFPLGWREPFHPWYRASHTHIRSVNVTHVTNVTNVNVIHTHRHRPHAVTVVPHRSFVSGGRAAESRLHLPQAELARAQVLRDRAPAEPVRANMARDGAAHRPRAAAAARVPQARAASPGPVQGASRPDARPNRPPGLEQRSEIARRARDARPERAPVAAPPAGPALEARPRGVEAGRFPGAGAPSRPQEQPVMPRARQQLPQTGTLPSAGPQQPSRAGSPAPESRRSAHEPGPRHQAPSAASAAHSRPGPQHEGSRPGRSAARQQQGAAGRPGNSP